MLKLFGKKPDVKGIEMMKRYMCMFWRPGGSEPHPGALPVSRYADQQT